MRYGHLGGGVQLTREEADIVISVMEDWFWAIERGEVNKRMPDVLGERWHSSEVDRVITHIDDFFDNELKMHESYWQMQGVDSKGVGIDTPPEFKRLTGLSRVAFVQQVKAAKGKAKLIAEARAVKEGVEIIEYARESADYEWE